MDFAANWRLFLRSRQAVLLTHGSLVLLTACFFGLVLSVDFRWALLPGVILAHRIGVMLHEYIHGIPFRSYRACLAVLAFYDGLLLMFGLLELFRGTHLSHHRWLNREGDSGFSESQRSREGKGFWSVVQALEVTQHVQFYFEAWRGKHPYVRGSRLFLGVVASFVWAVVWFAIGRPDMIWKLMVIAVVTTAVPVSLRGAVEHHSDPCNPGFANEYRVVLPLFNLNRHVHHHEAPRLPWYRLEFRTSQPLSEWSYYSHWFRVYLRKDLVLMRPMRRTPVETPPGPTIPT